MDPAPHDHTTDDIVKTTEDLLARSRQLLDDLDTKLQERGDRRGADGRRSA